MNEISGNIILNEALLAFTQITGASIKHLGEEIRTAPNKIMDAEIEIGLGKEKHRFFIETKHELRKGDLPSVLGRTGHPRASSLLVSKYIPMPMKEMLKKLNLNYLESAGNCFINAGGIFVYINDRQVTPSRQTPNGKLWKRAGLKFLFVLISRPALLNESYRTIALAAKIGLGNIGPLIEELKQKGHIKEEGDRMILQQRGTLIERWAELYQVVLRPNLQRGRFRFLHPGTRQEWKKINAGKFMWGGEPGGELYTDFLQPETFTIYSRQPPQELMKGIQIVPDGNGEVELVQQFWDNELLGAEKIYGHIVPPLLVYSDLIETGEGRNVEVAWRIKNKYLND